MSEFIYIPVPDRWASAIYKLLAELGEDGGAVTPPEDDVPFDRALVERMYRESHAGHRRLMEYLAGHEEEWIYTSELGEALALENGARGVAGMLGAFGKRSNHRYGGHKPWETEWDDSREEARHKMPLETAEIISSIAARER